MPKKPLAKSETGKQIRILVLDDHPMMCAGIVSFIESEKDMTVCGQLENGADLMAALKRLKPDVLVTDLSIGSMDGISLARESRRQYPGLKIVMFTVHDESVYAARAIQAGVNGYVMKERPPQDLIRAIRAVMAGEVYLDEKGMRTVVATLVQPEEMSKVAGSLSDRQRQVLGLMGDGYTTHEIADKLHVSAKTVETHRVKIKEKLGITDLNRLMKVAVEWAKR